MDARGRCRFSRNVGKAQEAAIKTTKRERAMAATKRKRELIAAKRQGADVLRVEDVAGRLGIAEIRHTRW